jgi:hypothetical protein
MYPLPPAGGYAVNAGGTVEVILYLETIPNAGVLIPALDMAMTFDPAKLEVVGFSFTGTILQTFANGSPPPSVSFDNIDGEIGLLFACFSCLTGGGGAQGGVDRPFVKLTFRGKSTASGSTFLRFVNSVNAGAGTAETRIFGAMALTQCTRASGGLVTTDVEIRCNAGTVVTRTVRFEVAGGGSIRANGQNFANGGTLQVNSGAQLTAEALADAANCWRFSAWSGGLSGSGSPQTITVNQDVTIRAAFVRDMSCLESHVTVMGPGDVDLTLVNDNTVRLSITAQTAPFFSGWSGAVESGAPSVDVPITELIAAGVVATFRDAVLFQRGDVDASNLREVTDAVFGLTWLASGGRTPPCLDAADVNDDGVINITDFIFLLRFLFLGGIAPPAPFTCGEDPTADSIGCDTEHARCAS